MKLLLIAAMIGSALAGCGTRPVPLKEPLRLVVIDAEKAAK